MHQPVLVDEVIGLLAIEQGGCYVDGTLGSGGHAAAILQAAGPAAFLVGMDRDREALERATERLALWSGQCFLARERFSRMADVVDRAGVKEVDGIILDLGVSSEQLESAGRGFSFAEDGPLDMRMDAAADRTAADLVNALSETELAGLIRDLGEEPRAGRIARAIVRSRSVSPLTTTAELAEVVAKAAPRRGRLHPATRTFQALRMAVNAELEELEEGLGAGLGLLGAGGRMAVISFHSLEDRMVKRFFRSRVRRRESLPGGGERWRGEEPAVTLITRKVVRPSDDETARNPRARSARLRVARKE